MFSCRVFFFYAAKQKIQVVNRESDNIEKLDSQAKHVGNQSGLLSHGEETQPFESHYMMNPFVSNLVLLQPPSILKLQQPNKSRLFLLVLKCHATMLIQLQLSYSFLSKKTNKQGFVCIYISEK